MSTAGRRRVSVVIPTHDRRRLLERTLRSVLAQEGVELEVLVVDDGSTDDTPRYLSGLRDERIRTIRHDRPHGVSIARNAGIAEASAPWIAFVDDDDLWSPRRLSAQLDAIDGAGTSWGCSATVVVDRDLAILGFQTAGATGAVLDDLLARNAIPSGGSGVIVEAEVVRRVGGFDERLGSVADWDLWIRLAKEGPVTYVHRPHVAYTVHGANMSGDVGAMKADWLRLAHKHGSTRTERGVELDVGFLLEYAYGLQVVAGNGRGAAVTKARLAARARSVRAAGGVVAVALAPQRMARRHWRRVLAVGDPGWMEEAAAWLAPLRATSAPGGGVPHG